MGYSTKIFQGRIKRQIDYLVILFSAYSMLCYIVEQKIPLDDCFKVHGIVTSTPIDQSSCDNVGLF